MQRQVFKRKNSGRNFRTNTNNEKNEKNYSDNIYEYNVYVGSKQYQRALQSRNKYLEMAREKTASGDKVGAEEFFQFADHYVRVINEAHEISRKFKIHNTDFNQSNNIQNDEENIISNEDIVIEENNIPAEINHVEPDNIIHSKPKKVINRRKYQVANRNNNNDNKNIEPSNEIEEKTILFEEVETSS